MTSTIKEKPRPKAGAARSLGRAADCKGKLASAEAQMEPMELPVVSPRGSQTSASATRVPVDPPAPRSSHQPRLPIWALAASGAAHASPRTASTEATRPRVAALQDTTE